MTDIIQAPIPQPPLAGYLRDAGITKVAIIDDAYDPPTRENLAGEIHDFWGAVVRDSTLLAKLGELKPGIDKPDDIDDELLLKLWKRLEALQELGPLLKSELFPTMIANLAPLKLLSASLEQLGITPVPFGSQDELSEPIRLIFLDYRLGPGTEAAVAAAKAKAQGIYDAALADADKPFIVLMSSHSEASAAKEDFREGARLLGGLFGYVPKEELQDREKLHLYLATWALDIPARHQIQHFVEALETALVTASKDFSRCVRSLAFQDYANIQWLSLHSDGRPLGDYMLWLYKSLLTHLLHRHPRVVDEQKKLDALSFEQFTPSQFPPSPQVAEIYRCALTEPAVGDQLLHPRAAEAAPTPLLRLGDLFFRDGSNDVLVAINAACDLAYAPGTSREFPKDRCVILLQGTLQLHEEVCNSKAMQTELFKHDEKVYRILWDHHRVTSKTYGEVAEWLRSQNYSRKARLALPYALQVQQEFAMQLMRIGVPVRPPIYRHADVEVFCKAQDGHWVAAGAAIRGAAVVIHAQALGKDDGEQFVLTVDGIGQIINVLSAALEVFENQKRALEAKLIELKPVTHDPKAKGELGMVQGKLQGVDSSLEKVRQLRVAYWWLPMARTPKPLPEKGKCKDVDPKLLRICHGADFEPGDTAGPPIRLNIRPGTSQPPAQNPQPAAEAIPKVDVPKEQHSV